MLVVWLGLTLCCALVCAREDVDEDKAPGPRETRGLVEHGRRGEEGGVEMSDEPAEVVEEEKKKPKKKKTPEEIEAGK